MKGVSIIGIGQTKVSEHWDTSLRELAVQSLCSALDDAGVDSVDALYVGNMLSGELSDQEHLATLISDFAGFDGIGALKIEAACASGAAAIRQGVLDILSGENNVVAVCGVEQMTDVAGEKVTYSQALSSDGDYELAQGISFTSLNALIMNRYMYEYGIKREDLAEFTVNAHKNAVNNPYAMFRREISVEKLLGSSCVSSPISILECSPVCDGSASVILCSSEKAKEFTDLAIKISASSIATDTLALHDREDILFLKSAYLSCQKAYKNAKIKPKDIGVFELHDAFPTTAALSLEACGFAKRGEGVFLAREGEIAVGGRIPISTMGGLKARGHPIGATGVYQVVEVVQQLRGEAGKNQVDADCGMTQNIGGTGATAITHILEV